jgi:polyisoprenoid-binding protein YceI
MRNRFAAILLMSLVGCSSHLTHVAVDSGAGVPATVPAGTVLLTPRNTRITFVGTALLASHEGTFTRFTGQIRCADLQPLNAHIAITIDMGSVYTEIPLLTRHLKADDFFDVAIYPEATFVSTSISTSNAIAPKYIVAGDLTLHGITRPISFPAQIQIDPAQVALDATIIIHQSDFRMASARPCVVGLGGMP